MKKRRRILFLAAVAAVVLSALYHGRLEPETYFVSAARLPAAFSGLRITLLTDLHGKEPKGLYEAVAAAKPDLIAISGDLIDERSDPETVYPLLTKLTALAPTYFVTGNHESRIPQAFAQLEERMAAAGAQILRNQSLYWEREGQRVQLIGLDDPSFLVQESQLEDHLHSLQDEDCYQILLSHRPELFDVYAAAGVDLSLTGHAHGGQFRIPFVGGVFAPAQGFFPRYDAGLYLQGQSAMVVSRGIGQSVIPVRLNNRPEIVLVELCSS